MHTIYIGAIKVAKWLTKKYSITAEEFELYALAMLADLYIQNYTKTAGWVFDTFIKDVNKIKTYYMYYKADSYKYINKTSLINKYGATVEARKMSVVMRR